MNLEEANKITTDLQNNVNLIEIRHKYKVRKDIHMSDAEYDKFIMDFKERIAIIAIRERCLTELILEKDENNKKVQNGKEESLEANLNKRFDGLFTGLPTEDAD